MMLLHGPSSNYSTNISVQRTAAASPSSSSTAATAAVVTKKKPTRKESFKRLPSIDEVSSTAPTEFCNSYGSSSSCRIISRNDDHHHDDDLDDFLESLESIYLNDDNCAIVKEEEDVLSKLMSYEQHTKFIVNEQQHNEQQQEEEEVGRAQTVTTTTNTDDSSQDNNTTTNKNTLELKIAKFQLRHKKRQHNRQSRIIKAQDDYIECLKALAETETSLLAAAEEVAVASLSIPPVATKSKYSSSAFDEVVWKEVQFDDD